MHSEDGLSVKECVILELEECEVIAAEITSLIARGKDYRERLHALKVHLNRVKLMIQNQETILSEEP